MRLREHFVQINSCPQDTSGFPFLPLSPGCKIATHVFWAPSTNLRSQLFIYHLLHEVEIDGYSCTNFPTPTRLFPLSLVAMNTVRKIGGWLAPPPAKSEDGRDQWPSRAAFVLASLGGAAGMGNLLRFPSQVYNNNGIQWFVPYLMAIFLIA